MAVLSTERYAVRRLGRLFREARAAGLDGHWYEREAARIRLMAHSAGVCGSCAIGAAAVLSPAVAWDSIMDRLEPFLSAWNRQPSADPPRMPGYRANTLRAWALLSGRYEPKGPKVRRFRRNLLGDLSCVTVDRWAIRAALGSRAPAGDAVNRGQYRELERAYQRAARIAGEEPARFQAAVWEHVRAP